MNAQKARRVLSPESYRFLRKKVCRSSIFIFILWYSFSYRDNLSDPSLPELLSAVRKLYETRVHDVRFLIPIVNYLTREEVLKALPKLIQHNEIIVREVITNKALLKYAKLFKCYFPGIQSTSGTTWKWHWGGPSSATDSKRTSRCSAHCGFNPSRTRECNQRYLETYL